MGKLQRVLAVGSCMVEFTPTKAGQSLKEAPTFYKYANGSVSLFAAAVARLGVPISLLSRVGADELGEFMKEALGALGIECKLVKSVKGMQTPVSFSWADQQGGKHFDFYRFPGFSDPMQSLQRKDFPQSLFEEYDFFDFSENMIRRAKLRAAALAAAARAQKAGCRVIYAVNLRLQAWQEPQASIRTIQRRALAASNVAVMNADELAFITKARSVEAGLKKIHSLGPEIVAVTAGEGVSLVSTPEGVTELPAFPVDVVYDVGAGDCFHGGFVAGLARGLAPASAGVLANAVAAWRVSKAARLEQLPTLEQIEEFIAHRY